MFTYDVVLLNNGGKNTPFMITRDKCTLREIPGLDEFNVVAVDYIYHKHKKTAVFLDDAGVIHYTENITASPKITHMNFIRPVTKMLTARGDSDIRGDNYFILLNDCGQILIWSLKTGALFDMTNYIKESINVNVVIKNIFIEGYDHHYLLVVTNTMILKYGLKLSWQEPIGIKLLDTISINQPIKQCTIFNDKLLYITESHDLFVDSNFQINDVVGIDRSRDYDKFIITDKGSITTLFDFFQPENNKTINFPNVNIIDIYSGSTSAVILTDSGTYYKCNLITKTCRILLREDGVPVIPFKKT